ncbi:MAG: ATP-binding protein [Fibrobacter sp.]|nr:ATP-binding protein [Fibrobacter sp.]
MKLDLSRKTMTLIFILAAVYLVSFAVILNIVHLLSVTLIGVFLVCYVSWKKGPFAGILLTFLNLLSNGLVFRLFAPEFSNTLSSAFISATVQIGVSILLGYFGMLARNLREEIERRKEVEHFLRELQADLEKRVEERTSELKKANELLFHSRKMEAIGQLSGTIAHDFNNYLNIILGYSTILTDTLDESTPAFRYAQNIENAAKTAAKMTSQLLTFARKKDFVTQSVDLNGLVNEMVPLLSNLIKNGITVTHVEEPQLPVFQGGTDLIKTALLNLCINAKDAMKNGGTLTISTQTIDVTPEFRNLHNIHCEDGLYSAVAVADTGTGIDSSVLEHIFEPFFTTKGEGKGTGLGLAAIYGIMKSHKGAIYVDTEPGKGTTFFMLFPTQVNQSQAA